MDSSIRKAYRAIEGLRSELFAAYYALASDLPKAKPLEDSVVLLNPYPYKYEDLIEVEIYPPVYVPEKKQYVIDLIDLKGNKVPYQIIKEESNIATQHRVRLLFRANIEAMSVAQYRACISFTDEQPKPELKVKEDIVVKDSLKTVVVSKDTGLLKSFKLGDKEYLAGEASVPMFFDDNSDPWGWRLYDLTATQFSDTGWPQEKLKNSLRPMKLDKKLKDLDPVALVEEGQYLTEVQAIFKKDDSKLVINYKIYKDTPYIDINYHVLWGEHNKGLKIKFPLNGDSKFFAQMAFGIEKYHPTGVEYPTNRYIGVENGDNAFVIYNKSGIHSASKKGKNLYVTFLNGASYCAHPTWPFLPLTPKGRYDAGVEQGAHDFNLRVGINKVDECERVSKEFNEPVYGTLFFPHGDGKVTKDLITLSNPKIVVSALKRRNNDTFLIRLYNGSFDSDSTELQISGLKKTIKFGKFEFKTFVYDGESIAEAEDSSIY